VPSCEKSKALGDLFGSGRVASNLALGVHVSQRLELEADKRACAVMIILLVFWFNCFAGLQLLMQTLAQIYYIFVAQCEIYSMAFVSN
jgi:hypothetical protein